jgi:CheY-like chemotaxis protein
LTSEEIDLVFKPFAQGEHAAGVGSGFGGLGLGLAITRSIAELHSGSISVRSPGRNQGATFTVLLPLGNLGESPSNEMPARTPLKGAHAKVLLVEDHDSSRDVLARILSVRNIETVQAASAAEALDKAKANTFDFIISDIGLPDGSGYDLMSTLKQKYLLTGIALSGFGSENDIARAKDAGFVLHLTKPVQIRKLEEALEKMMQK